MTLESNVGAGDDTHDKASDAEDGGDHEENGGPEDNVNGEQLSEVLSDAADTMAGVGEAVEATASKFEWVGRAGWVAKGLVYSLIGVLFIKITLIQSETGEANQAGALEAVAQTPGGTLLILAVGVGLALYSLWRLLTVVSPGDWTGRALLDRLGYAVSAGVYISLLLTILEIVQSADNDADVSEDRQIEEIVRDVLSITAGRTLVIIASVVVAIVGAVFIRKGLTRSFRTQISGADGIEETLIDRLGTIGWIARGTSMIIIGSFLAYAAWTFSPDQAAGLDDSIRQLADHPLGGILAAIVGVGFIAYGVFAMMSARHRDLKGPSNHE